MQTGVLIDDEVSTAIAARARAAWPREMVGLLAGDVGHVRAFAPLPNAAIAADRFAVAPAEFAAALAALERAGHAFLGFAHSHGRGDPAPSAIDRRELWRDCLQLVVVAAPGAEPRQRLWHLSGDDLHEVAVLTSRDRASLRR